MSNQDTATLGVTELTSAEFEAASIASLKTYITGVVWVENVTEHMKQTTFGGGDLVNFAPVGPDSFRYVLAPPPGRDELTVDANFLGAARTDARGRTPDRRVLHGAPVAAGRRRTRHVVRASRYRAQRRWASPTSLSRERVVNLATFDARGRRQTPTDPTTQGDADEAARGRSIIVTADRS